MRRSDDRAPQLCLLSYLLFVPPGLALRPARDDLNLEFVGSRIRGKPAPKEIVVEEEIDAEDFLVIHRDTNSAPTGGCGPAHCNCQPDDGAGHFNRTVELRRDTTRPIEEVNHVRDEVHGRWHWEAALSYMDRLMNPT